MSDQLPVPVDQSPVPSLPPNPAAAPPPLPSQKIVVQAPMSFTGSAKRIRNQVAKWERPSDSIVQQIGWATLVLVSVAAAWFVVLGWYCCFGILLVPFRIVRRGQRGRGLEDQRHAEMMAAIAHAQRPAHVQLKRVSDWLAVDLPSQKLGWRTQRSTAPT